MAELTIRLQIDPVTGKKDIVVDYHSDEDALPQEHEQMHRALVEKLVSGGLLKESELGKIIVERAEEKPTEKGSAAPETIESRKEEDFPKASGKR